MGVFYIEFSSRVPRIEGTFKNFTYDILLIFNDVFDFRVGKMIESA